MAFQSSQLPMDKIMDPTKLTEHDTFLLLKEMLLYAPGCKDPVDKAVIVTQAGWLEFRNAMIVQWFLEDSTTAMDLQRESLLSDVMIGPADFAWIHTQRVAEFNRQHQMKLRLRRVEVELYNHRRRGLIQRLNQRYQDFVRWTCGEVKAISGAETIHFRSLYRSCVDFGLTGVTIPAMAVIPEEWGYPEVPAPQKEVRRSSAVLCEEPPACLKQVKQEPREELLGGPTASVLRAMCAGEMAPAQEDHAVVVAHVQLAESPPPRAVTDALLMPPPGAPPARRRRLM